MKSFDDWYFELFESGNDSSLNQQEIAEEAWDFRQDEVDELRKRNKDAIAYIEHWYGCVELSNIVDILNGDMKWDGADHES